MRVSIAARNPDKSVLQTLEKVHGVRRYACGAIFKVFCSRRERRKMFLEIT
jgi:hypothetical protein